MLREPEEICPSFFTVGSGKITTSFIYFRLAIRGLDLSIIKKSFYVAPPAFPTIAANMIKDDTIYVGFLTNTTGCIPIGEVTPIYLWNPDISNLSYQKAPQAPPRIFSEIRLITYYATYLVKGRYRDIRPYFYVELAQDCKGWEKVFGISQLYIEFRMYYEQIKRYSDLSRSEQVKAKLFEEEFVQYLERSIYEIVDLIWISYAVTAIRKRYDPDSAPYSSLSSSIFRFFGRLRRRKISFHKILILFIDSIVKLLPEKTLHKRTQKSRIEPKTFKFLEGINNEDVLRLESVLVQSLPWSCVSTSINVRHDKNLAE